MEILPIDESLVQHKHSAAAGGELDLEHAELDLEHVELDLEHAEPTSLKLSLRDFILLFVRSESLAAFCFGYLILLACLAAFRLPLIGLGLSFVIESIAAGYYLRIMQDEIHGVALRSLALWPSLNVTDLIRLFKLGIFTNLIQVVYALLALGLSLPLFLVVCLSVGVGPTDGASAISYAQLFFSSAVFTMPFSFWVIVILAPVALARFAHSGKLQDAFDFSTIAKSGAWGSDLIKSSAAIYFVAIAVNSSLMTLAPALMNVFEPIIEFSSMALVCRLNARWYRELLMQAIAPENKAECELPDEKLSD